MSTGVRIQLSIMMFLEFFVWGAWFVPMAIYLGTIEFTGTDIGAAYSTTAWGAILSPILVGMIADRFFSAEKVMGVLHIAGGLILMYVATITDPGPFFWILLVYAACYMPTIALANAVAFNQMDDIGTEFPKVRVLGTIGWIVSNLVVAFLYVSQNAWRVEIALPEWAPGSLSGVSLVDFAFGTPAGEWTASAATATPLVLAGWASIVLGVFSIALLPKTPPRSKGEKVSLVQVLGLDAVALMKNRSFAIFAISSFLISIPLAFYYAFAAAFLEEEGLSLVTAKMSLGQMSEIVFMLVMPFFFRRLGVKYMLLVGMLAWTGRYALFAFGNNESLVFMYYAGIILHGICYDFFFVTGQIYVDQTAPRAIRANAQGFIALLTYGVGMVIGNNVAGAVVQNFEQAAAEGEKVVHAWMPIWLIPAGMAAFVTLVFWILFKDPGKPAEDAAELTKEGVTDASQSEAPA